MDLSNEQQIAEAIEINHAAVGREATLERYDRGWVGPEIAYKGSGEHLTAWCRFTLYGWPAGDIELEWPVALQAWIFGSGYVTSLLREWDNSFRP